MELRKILNYPPFGRLIIIVFSAAEEEGLAEKAEKFYELLKEGAGPLLKYGKEEFISLPFKAPIYKINGRFRYQIFIKFTQSDIGKVKNVIRKALRIYNEKKVRVSVDVDPVSMM